MKAITTTYHGPTNTRGARVIADDGDGNRVTVPYDSARNRDANHRHAAAALCHKLQWIGTLVQGETKEGPVFVFLDEARGDWKGNAFDVESGQVYTPKPSTAAALAWLESQVMVADSEAPKVLLRLLRRMGVRR